MRLNNNLNNINGRYGEYGGSYIPEILVETLIELKNSWKIFKTDNGFNHSYNELLKNYAGRATPLTPVFSFAKKISAPNIYLKREDLLHTGAHKINNALGQCLLAKKMGKTRIIAETGAGQHGVATAAACAHLGLECTVYMGKKDIERQAPNVSRMRLLGATIISVENGSANLKDAVNEALRDWSYSYLNTHYCLGSALGPHPFPEMVAYFQAVIGNECREQCLQQCGRLPDYIIACVGGGSNAIGIFSEFLDEKTHLIGVEAGGYGEQLGQHAARFLNETKGVLHGCFTYLLHNKEGQIAPTASISSGLNYPAISPQHAKLYDDKRVQYVSVSDEEALDAVKLLAETEGIISALESAHALAYLVKVAKQLPQEALVVINLSGRGDKDLSIIESFIEKHNFKN